MHRPFEIYGCVRNIPLLLHSYFQRARVPGFSHHTADTLAANSSLLRADPSVRPLAAVSLPMQSLPPSLPIAKRSRPEEAEWPSQGFRLDDEDPVGDEAARVAMLRGVVPPRPSELSYNSYQMPYPAAMQYQPTPSFSAVPPAPLRPQPRPSVPPRTQTPAPAPKPAKSKPKAATTGTTAAAPAKQAPVKAPAPAVTKGGPSVRPTAPVNPFGVPTEFGTFIDVPDATIKCYISHLMFDPAFAGEPFRVIRS